MNLYWYEHWQLGKMIQVRMVTASSRDEAVSLLSGLHKGVFLLKDRQTERQRFQENLKQYERIAGD